MNAEAPELTYAELMWSPEIWWFWAAMAFVFGLMFGSFFNVCIYRIPMGLSPNNPLRSFCFRCGSAIRWFDNVPVVSYLLLGGKCRDCGARYGPRYALVELLTGVLFLAVFLVANPLEAGPFQVATLWYAAFVGLLVVGTFTDLDHWIIPDGVTIGGGIAAVLAAIPIGLMDRMPVLAELGPFPVARVLAQEDTFTLVTGLLQGPTRLGIAPEAMLWWEPLANAVIGALFGMGILYGVGVLGRLMFGKEAMGLGDVKLFALIGGTLGAMGSLMTLVLACLFGALGGIAMMVAARLRPAGEPTVLDAGAPPPPEGDLLPDAPIPADAPWTTRLALAVRAQNPAPSVHHLPFGPWLALGAVATLLFHKVIVRLLF